MLFPKKVKHRKWQTKRRNPAKKSVATRGATLSFGAYGLKTMEYGRISSNQIEASRRVMRRALGKNGTIWVRIFPDRPVTQKAAEVGMGKGKGDPYKFVAEVQAGRMLFEIDGVAAALAREALRKGGAKMPVKAKIVARE